MDDSARLLVELDARINSSDRLSESECKSDVDDGNKFKSSIVTEEHQLIRHEIFPHDFNDFDQYCKFNSIDDISNNSLALDERLLEWCDGIDVGEIFDFIDDMDITELENITMDVELKSNDNFMLVGSFGDEAFANFDVHIEQHLHDEREGCSVSPFTRSQIEENHFDGSKSSRECIGQTGLLWSDVTSELNSCNGSSDICHDMEDEECAYVQEFTEVASKSTSVMNTRMRKKVRSRGINEVKREQNRTAACRYRKRKLELKQDMRKEIHILELRNIELETQISSFQKEIDFLKNIFTLHASSAELNFRRVL